jgi:hypothetical protein
MVVSFADDCLGQGQMGHGNRLLKLKNKIMDLNSILEKEVISSVYNHG